MQQLRLNDYVDFNDCCWQVAAISDSGLITLRNVNKIIGKRVPASIVLTPDQVKQVHPLIKIIRHTL